MLITIAFSALEPVVYMRKSMCISLNELTLPLSSAETAALCNILSAKPMMRIARKYA